MAINVRVAYYRTAMGIVVVYDVSDEKSFSNIPIWLKNIDQHASEDVIKILVGNKCDINERRVISFEQGKQLADKYGLVFFETSAKANENVNEVFYTMATEIKKKIDEMNKKNGLSKLSLVNSHHHHQQQQHNHSHSKGVNMQSGGNGKSGSGKTTKCCLIT